MPPAAAVEPLSGSPQSCRWKAAATADRPFPIHWRKRNELAAGPANPRFYRQPPGSVEPIPRCIIIVSSMHRTALYVTVLFVLAGLSASSPEPAWALEARDRTSLKLIEVRH